MLRKTKKIIAALICLLMIFTALASCGRIIPEGTVVVSSTEFNGVFNPPFAKTAYDAVIADLVNVSLYKFDRKAELEGFACDYRAPAEFKGDDGNTWVKYTFRLKNGIKFSDGEPVTADDIIFTYMVYLDPTYDGSSVLFTLPILGLEEYTYDTANYEEAEKEAERIINENADKKINDADWMLDWLVAAYSQYGYTADDLRDYTDDEDEKEEARTDAYIEAKSEYMSDKYASGTASVSEIAGIKKINNRTVEVTLTEVSPVAEQYLSVISILPQHYYGADFKKGDLSGVKKLDGAPLGAGPYIFESYANNVVSLIANDSYFEGTPKIERLVYQVVDPGNEYAVLKNGEVDIADPSAEPEMLAKVEEDGFHYELIDNLGYGYIGVSAKMTPDVNVRKALMSLMNRGPAVETYYGNLAVVIERPISMVSWAYPQDAKAFYEYSKDKALEYFKAAGYTQEGGKLVKNGTQYSVNLYISSADHPVVPVFTQMKSDLESLGAKCDIVTLEWSAYSEKFGAGEAEVWAAAWGATPDPDMTQVYHSNQIATGNNPYHINNSELDKLLEDGVKTMDREKRKEIYSKALDIVMQEAVEMPFYQRKNMYAMQQERIDIESLPENMTPYYEWAAEIIKLRTVVTAEAQ